MIVTMLSDEIRTYALRLAVVEPPSLAAADLAGPGKPNVNSSPPPAMALVFRKSRRDARPISPAAATVAAADWSGELGERRRRDTVCYIPLFAGSEPKPAAAACYTLALSQPPCQKRSAKITPRNATSPHRANQMPIKL